MTNRLSHEQRAARGRAETVRRLEVAFAKASREDAELRRLRATGRPFAALEYEPERLGMTDTTTNRDSGNKE